MYIRHWELMVLDTLSKRKALYSSLGSACLGIGIVELLLLSLWLGGGAEMPLLWAMIHVGVVVVVVVSGAVCWRNRSINQQLHSALIEKIKLREDDYAQLGSYDPKDGSLGCIQTGDC